MNPGVCNIYFGVICNRYHITGQPNKKAVNSARAALIKNLRILDLHHGGCRQEQRGYGIHHFSRVAVFPLCLGILIIVENSNEEAKFASSDGDAFVISSVDAAKEGGGGVCCVHVFYYIGFYALVLGFFIKNFYVCDRKNLCVRYCKSPDFSV